MEKSKLMSKMEKNDQHQQQEEKKEEEGGDEDNALSQQPSTSTDDEIQLIDQAIWGRGCHLASEKFSLVFLGSY